MSTAIAKKEDIISTSFQCLNNLCTQHPENYITTCTLRVNALGISEGYSRYPEKNISNANSYLRTHKGQASVHLASAGHACGGNGPRGWGAWWLLGVDAL